MLPGKFIGYEYLVGEDVVITPGATAQLLSFYGSGKIKYVWIWVDGGDEPSFTRTTCRVTLDGYEYAARLDRVMVGVWAGNVGPDFLYVKYHDGAAHICSYIWGRDIEFLHRFMIRLTNNSTVANSVVYISCLIEKYERMLVV